MHSTSESDRELQRRSLDAGGNHDRDAGADTTLASTSIRSRRSSLGLLNFAGHTRVGSAAGGGSQVNVNPGPLSADMPGAWPGPASPTSGSGTAAVTVAPASGSATRLARLRRPVGRTRSMYVPSSSAGDGSPEPADTLQQERSSLTRMACPGSLGSPGQGGPGQTCRWQTSLVDKTASASPRFGGAGGPSRARDAAASAVLRLMRLTDDMALGNGETGSQLDRGQVGLVGSMRKT